MSHKWLDNQIIWYWISAQKILMLILGQEPGKLVIVSHVKSLSRGKSRHPIRNSTPFFVIRLSLTSLTKHCVLLFDFSKTLLLVHEAWDFLLTDDHPHATSPSPTLPSHILSDFLATQQSPTLLRLGGFHLSSSKFYFLSTIDNLSLVIDSWLIRGLSCQ
jgi:hypothetical protein